MYYSAKIASLYYCGFDNRGNLYADGQDASTGAKVLFALMQGSGALTEIALSNVPVTSFGAVQWDGHHLALSVYRNQTPAYIYRLKFNGNTALSVGKTILRSGQDKFRGQSLIVGNHIIAITNPGRKSDSNIGVWRYTAGGREQHKMLQVGPLLQGLAFSETPKM